MKRILSVLTVLALMLSFVACADDTDTDSETTTISGETTTISGETTTGGETTTTVTDTLGFPSENNSGTVFTVLLNNSAGFFDLSTDFYAENDDGSRVNGETFKRNNACEEYLGISLNYIQEPGNYNSKMPDKIYTDVYSNDVSSYDMVVMGLNTGIMSGYVDCFYDVAQMPGIDLSHDWWIEDMVDSASVNGRMIFLAGDCCISFYGYLGCIFANLSLTEDFQLGVDYYELVENREWTLERFLALSESVRQDRLGDGLTSESDIFGWANCSTGVRALWSCCNMQLLERETDGAYVYKTALDNTILDFIASLKLASDRENTFYFGNPDAGARDAFIEDRCLFLSYYVYLAGEMTEMKNGYAILPMPLYNSTQEDYISTNVSAFNALFFPTNVRNPKLSAKVAEFMGWYGQANIIPAYYDLTLKYQYNNVEDNVKMLDLIRDRLRISPNELFGTIGNSVGLTAMTEKNTASDAFYSTPVSVWENKFPAYDEALNTYMTQYFS